MKKISELPTPVNNLRKIWDQKKVEMKFTQVQAAEQLGWTQGAISHYLNNITELGPAATIKFANFLGVDPRDIDPNVVEHLPNVTKLVARYNSSNANKVIDKPYYVRTPSNAFWIDLDVENMLFHRVDEDPVLLKTLYLQDATKLKPTIMAQVCPVKDLPNVEAYIATLKGEKEFHYYRADALPPASKISKKFAVIRVNFFLSESL